MRFDGCFFISFYSCIINECDLHIFVCLLFLFFLVYFYFVGFFFLQFHLMADVPTPPPLNLHSHCSLNFIYFYSMCVIITFSFSFYLSIDTTNLYCPITFDGYKCWPETQASTTAVQHCPEFVIGFDPKLFAHKK